MADGDKLIGTLGDVNFVSYGGGKVLMNPEGDRPQVEYLPYGFDEIPEGMKTLPLYRFDIDKCTYTEGILSENPYHPSYPAWWADRIVSMANTYGEEPGDLIAAFCSDDPMERALAYVKLGEYFGFEELDSYPLQLTPEEGKAWGNKE